MKTKSIGKSKIIISSLVLVAMNLLSWIEPHLPALKQIVTDSGVEVPDWVLHVLNMAVGAMIAKFRLTSNTAIAAPLNQKQGASDGEGD